MIRPLLFDQGAGPRSWCQSAAAAAALHAYAAGAAAADWRLDLLNLNLVSY
jgi:hypothetical protein